MPLPLYVLFATVLVDVIIDILLNPEPTSNLKRLPEKRKDPPPVPPVKDPPQTDPPNKIKPPPIVIFREPPNDQPPITKPPIRILPPVLPVGTSTNTENNITSIVKESLLDHKFGCLLSRPFYEASEFYCEYENTTFTEFYDTIKSDMETEKSEIESEIESGETGVALRLAPAFLSLDNYSQPSIIVGSKQLHKISSYYAKRSQFASNFPITGLISVGETIINDCTIVTDYIEEPKFLTSEDSTKECAVPMAMFDELEGYKADQLQIIWRNNDWETQKKPRYFTFPNPIDVDSLGNALDGLFSSFTFGSCLIEIWLKITGLPEAIRPIQKCKIYTDFKNKDDCKSFVEGDFTTWLEALTDNVSIKTYQFIFLDDNNYYVGNCTAYRAVLMGWDTDKKHWCNKADWLLKQSNP